MRTIGIAAALMLVLGLPTPAASDAETPRPADGVTSADPLEQRPGLRWLRRSAEYSIIVQSIYRNAGVTLASIVADRQSETPWIVAMDADETVLDNSRFEAARVEEGFGFDETKWRQWIGSSRSSAVPGSVAFIEDVFRLGGKVALITDRPLDLTLDTRRNLEKIGVDVDPERLCILGVAPIDEQSGNSAGWLRYQYRNDKDRRRRLLREGVAEACWSGVVGADQTSLKAAWSVPHDIVMHVGDEIGDLPGQAESVAQNGDKLRDLARNGGYVLLPNPVYGSWEKRKQPRAD